MDSTTIIASVVAILIGGAVGYLIRQNISKTRSTSAERRAERLLEDAKTKEKELILAAKDKAIEIVDAAKREESHARKELDEQRQRVEKRESLFDQRLLDLEKRGEEIAREKEKTEKSREEIGEIKKQQLAKLERVAALTQEEAKQHILAYTENQVKDDVMNRIHTIEQSGIEEYETKARSLVAGAIERYAGSQVSELTTTTVTLPSEDMKGRIIGREGRNIKAIEAQTGTEIIVDETPLAITISGFSLVRRHVAKRALERLIADGRIQPAKIEDAVEEAKKEIATEMKKAGEDALYQMGITGIDPKLVQILGRLKFRTSYGQNVLLHSMEVAQIAGMLAQEIGANVAVAKKGGLFHDIGKAVDHDIPGTHLEIGYQILKKFGFPEEIAYHCISHHEDHPKSVEGILTKVADAISASRPGARKDSFEQYVKRLEELEAIANSFEGVEKTYAIQAGREIRLFVTPSKIDDYAALKLAQDCARKISQELQFPGEVKVTVIRENRFTEYAR